MAEILYGAPAAEAIRRDLKERLAALQARGITPCLAAVRAGENAGALSYERAARRACEGLGVSFRAVTLPETCGNSALLRVLRGLSADPAVHGCLLLRPLPKQIDEHAVSEAIAPEKDVDGVTSQSLRHLFTGCGPGHCPCTPEAVLALLDHYRVPLDGARVTVLGRSLIVGKPLSLLLTGRSATVTLCHSHTRDLPERCREADILIPAAGSAGLIGADWVRPGQVILDVGTSLNAAGKLCGDVDFERVAPRVAALSPVPGGVGAVTTAVLLRHVVETAENGINHEK